MAVQLCDQEQMDVFKIIKICFKNVQHFDFRISKELQQYLAEVRLDEIMVKSKKGHTQKYFDMMFYNSTADTRAVFKYIDLAFKCANVLILLLKGTFQSLLWNNVSQLLLAYPEFQNSEVDSQEQVFLLNFRNTIRVAMEIIPANANKQLLINIAGRLEGSVRSEYITGGGQKPGVSRRVKIYEHEGMVQPKHKAPKTADRHSKQLKCTNHKYVSRDKAKAIQPTEGDIMRVSKRIRHESDSVTISPEIFDNNLDLAECGSLDHGSLCELATVTALQTSGGMYMAHVN